MFSEGFSFPHPVLGLDDDIGGEFSCSMEVRRVSEARALEFFNIAYELNNDYVRSFVDRGDAGILIKIYCSSTFKTWIVVDPGESFQLDENDLYNKVEIHVLVVTKKVIEEYSDLSFNHQYSGHKFSVNSKEIIAVSGKVIMNIEKVNEKLGLGNIFKFFSRECDRPLEFSYGQDKIYIMYPVDENGDHPPNALFKSKPWTAYSLFILPALTGAFSFAQSNQNEASEYEWYQVIAELFPESEWQSDGYVNAQFLLNKEIPILSSYHELKN